MTNEDAVQPSDIDEERAVHRRLLLAVVFLCGGISIGTELAMSRLLAPYFGTSTFIWANLIGLTLAFLAIGVLAFQGNWNNFEGPLIYLNTTQLFPLIVSIQFFQQSLTKEAPKWHYMMAMATMMAAPILLLFFMAQRYFIEGLNVGAVKG